MGRNDRAVVAGVDGCPGGGWVAALVGPTGVTWRLLPDAASIVALDAAVVGVDIPIGLSDGPRECDLLARAALGARRCCVFPAPPRPVLDTGDHPTASSVHREIRGVGMSVQAFHLFGRIRSVDAALTPALQERVVEVHPELSFAVLAGTPLPTKKRAAGRALRQALLAAELPGVDEAMRSYPRPARADDALDALVCAWTARRCLRGEALAYPPDPAYDDRGLRMEIHA